MALFYKVRPALFLDSSSFHPPRPREREQYAVVVQPFCITQPPSSVVCTIPNNKSVITIIATIIIDLLTASIISSCDSNDNNIVVVIPITSNALNTSNNHQKPSDNFTLNMPVNAVTYLDNGPVASHPQAITNMPRDSTSKSPRISSCSTTSTITSTHTQRCQPASFPRKLSLRAASKHLMTTCLAKLREAATSTPRCPMCAANVLHRHESQPRRRRSIQVCKACVKARVLEDSFTCGACGRSSEVIRPITGVWDWGSESSMNSHEAVLRGICGE